MYLNRKSVSPLSDSQIRSVAPSVFADAAHASRSDRYTYIPTVSVVDAMRREGFEVVSASQSRSRDASRREFTKHMLKFARADLMAALVGDSIPQICLINSHDGTSTYKLIAGMLRLVCLNGLMVADGEFAALSVPHKGDVVRNVIDGSYTVIDHASRAAHAAQEWRGITLEHAEQEAFARGALALRWDGVEANGTPKAAPVTVEQVLRHRRPEDKASDLWTTFNRVQENVMRGGLTYRGPLPGNGRRARNLRTREVTGIDTGTTLNRALWRLAEEMRALKLAA